jgi:hypothetical protein
MEGVTPEALVRLDRKVSRALVSGKGLKLSDIELASLAEIGMIEQLATAKAQALKEQGRWRQSKVVSISADRSGLTSSEAQMVSLPATDGTSGGMMSPPAGNSGEARARQMFG